MITSEKYIILDKCCELIDYSLKLCIINFNILVNFESVKKLIDSCPNTTFWAATKDFSQAYIKAASKLGIKNVISLPVKTEQISEFFAEDKNVDINEINPSFLPLQNSKVMIVDDNILNVKLLKDILSDFESDMKTFTNPEESIELIKKEKYDLFLLDILMPEMSGFELAEVIKKSELNNSTPIIFISAISGTENILNGYNLGAYSYIEKPFHPNIVKLQIYNILRAEELKNQKEKEKENFIASLTHDLKSPINAEITALNYLLEKSPNNKIFQNEMLSELLNSAKYMRLITDKILSHYRQKNSKLNLKKEKCSLREIILSSIEEMKYLCEEKNIKIRLLAGGEKFVANVDFIEITRVINNLISNAVEYSRKDGVIDIELKSNKRGYSCIVRDYGIGIDLSNYRSVFDEYVSLSKEQKKVGFGLGLNICKSIIKAHGGEIKIYSTPNKGTEVVFSIPK